MFFSNILLLFRLVRFDGFLSRVPYSNESKGFGGSCQHPNNDNESTKTGTESAANDLKDGADDFDDNADDYDKALVQKIIVLVLKSVALTTREAR